MQNFALFHCNRNVFAIDFTFQNIKNILEKLFLRLSMHKVLSSELFWSVFSCIQTEYGASVHIKPECRKIWTRITPNKKIFHAVFAMSVLVKSRLKVPSPFIHGDKSFISYKSILQV